jgi:peroxin-19
MDQSTSMSVQPEKPHDATSAAPSEGKQPQPTPPAKVEQAAQKDEDEDDDDDDESDLDDLDGKTAKIRHWKTTRLIS